jgi:hypothetical protein
MKTNRILFFFVLAIAILLLAGVIVTPAQAEDTPTPTETPTPTTTSTPTTSPTPTATPYAGITWADSNVDLSSDMQDTIADLLHASPPAEAESDIYAVTDISGSGTTWNVSLVNLVDVTYPFSDWNQEDNAVWAWFVVCEGTDPTWSCDYYDLPEGGTAGDEKLLFPWQIGKSALYGVMGVHRDTNSIITGSYAVDFVGGDTMGANVMLPNVIAVTGGTITNVCSDGISMAIRVDGGPVAVAYFHFDTGNEFTAGQTIVKGQVLGSLKYGPFVGLHCGWGAQAADQYHLHFVFLPTSSGYLEIGGCVLNLSTENFVCNSNTYAPLTYIPNGGGTPDDPPIPGSGGVHLWDGIVDLFVKLSTNTVSQYLPTQTSIVGYVLQKVALFVQFAFELYFAVYAYGLTGTVLTMIISSVIAMELVMKVIDLAISLWKEFGWLLKYLIPI